MEKPPITQALFFLGCCALAVISIFFDLKYLSIAIPLVLLLILFTYLRDRNNKIKVNLNFIISIACLMVLNFLIYADYTLYFYYICVVLTLYCIFSSLALKKYLTPKPPLNRKTANISFIATFCLLFYLIYTLADLVLEYFPNALLFVIIAVIGLLIHSVTSYYIFYSDQYSIGTLVLISFIILIYMVCFTIINEVFLLKNIFTVFIAVPHVIGIYIFMKFLVNQNPNEVQNSNDRYL